MVVLCTKKQTSYIKLNMDWSIITEIDIIMNSKTIIFLFWIASHIETDYSKLLELLLSYI